MLSALAVVRLSPEFADALEDPPHSQLLAILPQGSAAPGVSDALVQLERASLGVSHASAVAPEHPGARWEIEVELDIPGRGEPAVARAWLEPAPRDLLMDGVAWRGVSARDLDDGRHSTWAVGVSLGFAGNPLADYHAQARLLFALAPEAILVLDVNAVTPRPGAWLRDLAEARVPPAPATMFTIHDVGEPGAEEHWLHTHGLNRCGSVELDALAIPGASAGLVGQLMNSVAALFIEQGLPEPDEPFEIGEGIEVVWLPWREGVKKVSGKSPGGADDRDEAHRGARAVLFVPKRGLLRSKYESLARHVPLLEQNPLLYVSAVETERMSLLASERLPRFAALFERFRTEDEWLFLVKLGYAVDGAENAADREHLWFQVHGLHPGEVDATLLNAPYRVERLREGQRGRHALELLTDWAILCHRGRFDADTIAELERALSEQSQLH